MYLNIPLLPGLTFIITTCYASVSVITVVVEVCQNYCAVKRGENYASPLSYTPANLLNSPAMLFENLSLERPNYVLNELNITLRNRAFATQIF